MTDRLKLAAFSLLFAGLIAWSAVACTSSQAATGAQVASVVCEAGTVLLDEPGLAAICATIPEIEAAIDAWRNEKAVSPAPKTKADLQKAVLASRAAKVAK